MWGRPRGLGRSEHEDGQDPGRLLLVRRVVGKSRDGPVPPGVAFGAMYLPGRVVLLDRAILQLDPRVRGQVVVPDRMLGRSALARYDPVLTVVLNAHHRVLAQLPRLGAHRGKDDHRFALHRVSLGTAGALVEFDLITGPSG